ncbi:cupin domain-containing protein [Polluticaenibacter yanchengensis]|uniref:Mannose-6-phosphate isomerase type II C-terminal domain-containing protein n=1 Tax=Polluticaenibacter yanchengensis TaxID=3014562 RepID=A0ABT4ULD5_9BACT|nr:hypothetical protein [Chitinophagaceae bacterium LY-5]
MQKQEAFEEIQLKLNNWGYNVVNKDDSRPWGGFFVLDESQVEKFAGQFFAGEDFGEIQITEKLSPKILLVAPAQRLSWQYHHRRAEIWKCIGGTVGVITSDDDTEKIQHTLNTGDIIKLKQGERHRLIGLDGWGFVAEIWQHTDVNNPSNEDDIVRVQDDFGR